MAKYLKIPTRSYKGSEITAKLREDDDNEITRLYKEAGYEEPGLSCVITWMRLPISDLEGCSYDSTTSIQDSDIEFETGEFSSSLLILKDGTEIATAWPIDYLENMLIKYGIVDEDIKDQKEFL